MSYGTITPPPPRQFRPTPPPNIPPATQPVPGVVLHDSWVHTNLHNKIPRTVTREGMYECRASGNPRIQVNPDGTFSLITQAGHGRIYGYVPNYNVYMVVTAAFWNQSSGQDMSFKIRSRHNEADPCANRFGGYGFHFDRGEWGSKTESCHNNHHDSVSGRMPFPVGTRQYMQIEFSVKDLAGGRVQQIGKINGATLLNRQVARQPLGPQYFIPRSYWWLRSNVDNGTSEIRVKRIQLFAI